MLLLLTIGAAGDSVEDNIDDFGMDEDVAVINEVPEVVEVDKEEVVLLSLR